MIRNPFTRAFSRVKSVPGQRSRRLSKNSVCYIGLISQLGSVVLVEGKGGACRCVEEGETSIE